MRVLDAATIQLLCARFFPTVARPTLAREVAEPLVEVTVAGSSRQCVQS